jgi:hypothetical protein
MSAASRAAQPKYCAGIGSESPCFVTLNKINNLAGGDGSTLVAFPPPLALEKPFSRSGCGRIVPLYSKVMREGLFTGPGAKRAQSVLYWPIFSGPVDCADLVKFHKCKILLSYSSQMFPFGRRSRLVQRRLASEFLRP